MPQPLLGSDYEGVWEDARTFNVTLLAPPNDYDRAASISQHARGSAAIRAEFVSTAIITMCYAKLGGIKQENACITSSSRPDGLPKKFKILVTPVAYFPRVPHLLGDRAPFESRPETVGWLR